MSEQHDETDALDELINLRSEIGSVKRRAYADVRKLSRQFASLFLLADDLYRAGSLDDAIVEAREREARLKVTIADLEQRRVDLGQAIEESQRRLDELRAEEARLDPLASEYRHLDGERRRLEPIVVQFRDIEARLPEMQRAITEAEARWSEAEARWSEAEARRGETEAALAAVRNQLDETQSRHAEVTATLSKIKAGL